jgi:hypothetical protein
MERGLESKSGGLRSESDIKRLELKRCGLEWWNAE